MTGPEQYPEAERLRVHARELLVTDVCVAEESLQRAAAVLAQCAGSCHAGGGRRARAQRQPGRCRHAGLA